MYGSSALMSRILLLLWLLLFLIVGGRDEDDYVVTFVICGNVWICNNLSYGQVSISLDPD